MPHNLFKDLASRYDAWYQTPLGALAHDLESEAIFHLAEVKPGERAIDIGCGTGIYTMDLARRGAQVIGLDASIEMLTLAREKFRRAGRSGRFICGSAEALPFRSESFDLAIGVTSLCFVPSPVRAVEEIRRALRPGGRLVLGELNRFSLWAAWRRLKGLFTNTIYNQAHFWGLRELKRLLTQADFHVDVLQTLIYFPPINRRTLLKTYRLYERPMKKLIPGGGAFIALKAERN